MMQTFVRRPRATTAVQLRWSTWNDVCELLGDALVQHNPEGACTVTQAAVADTCGEPGPDYITLSVLTANGHVVPVRHGDWIIPDSEPGTFYPCAPDVFARDYVEATAAAPAEGDLTARALAAVLLDLDRCEHGRHSLDPCHSCPDGKSTGNKLMPPGRAIGHTVHGDRIWVPPADQRHDPKAWRIAPADPAAADDPAVNAVYRERNRLVAALTTRWPSVVTPAPDFDGWWIVYINGPAGQMSFHFSPDDHDLFAHVHHVDTWEWDGHDTTTKYERLADAAGITREGAIR